MNQVFALIIFTLLTCCNLFSQVEDTTAREQEEEEVIILQNFARKHQRRLGLMRRVYPIALSAKVLVEAHQEELEGITKKRKRKKLGKKTHKKLKEEFNYNIRDLYKGEGALLIRLVHRETGMTVAEIIELFEGKSRRKWYNGLAKLGGQDLESEYDVHGEDYLTEFIIDEIEAGEISFSLEMNTVDKTAFKEGMDKYRSDRKTGRKYKRRSKKRK
jgi:hypothetical protein